MKRSEVAESAEWLSRVVSGLVGKPVTVSEQFVVETAEELELFDSEPAAPPTVLVVPSPGAEEFGDVGVWYTASRGGEPIDVKAFGADNAAFWADAPDVELAEQVKAWVAHMKAAGWTITEAELVWASQP